MSIQRHSPGVANWICDNCGHDGGSTKVYGAINGWAIMVTSDGLGNTTDLCPDCARKPVVIADLKPRFPQ